VGNGRKSRYSSTMAERRIGTTILELVQGDIVQQDVDAIVNAANTTLLGGGGVDGAIHRAGGPAILAECRTLGGCATGDAKMTGGGRLRARHVIHAVGPVYRDGRHGEAELLASAYRRSLEVGAGAGLRSIAFPSISTGAYRFPIREAAGIALAATSSFLSGTPHAYERVRFVLFGAADLAVYTEVLGQV
jgi:O-acetyl-ADP-ribose deacetylase (regulator of RNase III)